MSKVGNDTRARLDFVNVHYYDWMNPWFTPWSQTPAQWGLTKPCVVTESQGNSTAYNAVAQRDGIASKGHAGICYWSYWGGDGAGAWTDFQNVFVGWNPPGSPPPPVTIYADALAADWADWSWSSTVAFNETTIKKNGTASTRATANAGWSAVFRSAKELRSAPRAIPKLRFGFTEAPAEATRASKFMLPPSIAAVTHREKLSRPRSTHGRLSR